MKKLTLFLVLTTSSFAGDCVLTVTRTACPGQEVASYSKCDGKQSCNMKSTTDTAESCAAAALAECVNVPARQQITKSKTVTAEFDGQPVENGKNYCDPNRPDFNKCVQ